MSNREYFGTSFHVEKKGEPSPIAQCCPSSVVAILFGDKLHRNELWEAWQAESACFVSKSSKCWEVRTTLSSEENGTQLPGKDVRQGIEELLKVREVT